MSNDEKADRTPRIRDYYLTELDQATYWEIMSVLVEEEEFVVCGRPADEEPGHIHDGERQGWEWIAPLVVMEASA